MEIIYQPKALDDLKYWKKSGQKQIQVRYFTYFNPFRKLLMKVLENRNLLNIIILACGRGASVMYTDWSMK